jgi:glycosyltransferase involved in cell wall biosynthesis
MNALIVSAVFPPEPVVTAQTSFQIAEGLAADGHQVVVLAPFPSRPDGVLFKGYKRSLYRTETTNFRTIRCFSFLSQKSTMASRLLENISFGLTSSLRVLLSPRVDILYMNSWPVFATGMVAAAAWLRGMPTAISVQDIYPESLTQQKRLSRKSRIFKLLRRTDRRIARFAKALIVISDRFRETYLSDREVPADRIHVIPNWGDSSAVAVDARGAYALRRRHGIPDHAVLAVYGGNIGAAAGVETAIRAFEYLWSEDNLYLLIAGAGSHLRACQDLVQEKGLQDRIFFHTPWPKSETGTVLGAGDLLLLPTQGEQSLVSVPSKLISYMLSGRPVLAGVLDNSDTAALIREAQAGWVVPPDDPETMATALQAIAASAPDELRAGGARALDYALSHLTREGNLPRVLQLLSQVARAQKPAAATVHKFNA